MDYHRQHKVAVKIARIFNTYGPHMHPGDGRVVSNFIVQALTGQPITIYGDGHQTRSLCYVSDTVDGLMRLMDSPATTTGPLNIGNPCELSMLAIADTILELTGSRSRIVHAPLPADDPRQRCPDITRAREELGWAPSVELREGLMRTIAWFDETLQRRGATPVRNAVPQDDGLAGVPPRVQPAAPTNGSAGLARA
jgi:UDP-glucuronate decarboxylase